MDKLNSVYFTILGIFTSLMLLHKLFGHCTWSQLIRTTMVVKLNPFPSLDYRTVLCLNTFYSYFHAPRNVLGIARSRVPQDFITLYYNHMKENFLILGVLKKKLKRYQTFKISMKIFL